MNAAAGTRPAPAGEMMTKLFIALFLLLSLALQGCAPTYPAGRAAESAKKLLKKELRIDSDAKLVGRTLYLEISLPGLVTSEREALERLFKKIDGAAMSATRVALSSDGTIDTVTVTARDPSWGLTLRIIRRLEDIKSFFYQRISKSDFEDRMVLEIENREDGATIPAFALENSDIGIREFMGRLVVSQVNMLSRTNPFLGVMIGSAGLRYRESSDDEIVIGIDLPVNDDIRPLLETLVRTRAEETLRKYKVWSPSQVRLIGQDDRVLLIPLHVRQKTP